jgi:uncharacterized radical SAM superfamily protein
MERICLLFRLIAKAYSDGERSRTRTVSVVVIPAAATKGRGEHRRDSESHIKTGGFLRSKVPEIISIGCVWPQAPQFRFQTFEAFSRF